MLRSYEYTEQSYSNVHLQSDILRDKEINLAYRFSEQLVRKCESMVQCPICEKNLGKYFYTKWDVDYLLCQNCGSIYASCTNEDVEQYKKNEDLLHFRKSEVYQKEISERRKVYWEDFLEWMQIRAFRFLKKNKDLQIIDVGNRYEGFVEKIKKSEICGQYQMVDSILDCAENGNIEQADLIFYFDQMQNETEPIAKLRELYTMLKDRGLLIIGTRAGSGFDILTLKEHNRKIYPYEHVVLPSVKGLVKMLERNGYKILEITTPGIMDIQYVKDDQQYLDNANVFIKNLMSAEDSVLQEFQRFLQKNSMSSFVRVIATKEKSNV